MSDPAVYMRYQASLNRVAKWRNILSGRIWGTQAKTPEAKGRADLFEKLIILRAEVSAMNALLVKNGVYTIDQYMEQIIEECDHIDMTYAASFPGIRATEHGIEIYDVQKANETMKGWPA